MKLLALILTACAARAPASSSSGVPPTIWRAPAMHDADGCEPWWFAPSVLCAAGPEAESMQYDGCRWTCAPWSFRQ